MVQLNRFLPVALSLTCVVLFTACGQQVEENKTNALPQSVTDSSAQNAVQPDQTQNTNASEEKLEETPAFTETADVLCTLEYMPVCGKRQIQCITAPCDPIEQTFSNRCVAESEGAIDIVDGACAMSADDF